jgi:hypothetical protein
MADALDAVEQEIGDYLTGQGTATTFGTGNSFVGLFTGAAGNDDGTGWTEVTGGSYAREALSATNMAPTTTAGVATNDVDITFTTATASWGTVTYAGVFSAVTAGTLGAVTALDASKTVGDGDTFEFAAGDFSVTVA